MDEGRTNREIAQIMNVSLGTVGRKRAALYPRPVKKEEANLQQEKGANGGEPPPVDSEQMTKQDQALVTMVPTNRPLMEAVIKNMSWWQQAVQDIGSRAIFLAISTAESDKDVNQRLAGFKTEQEFVDYISSILSALYDAKKDAQKLLALKEDLRDAQVTADLYKIYASKLEKSNAALQTMVTTLISALPPDVARKLAVWAILQAYGTGALKSSDGAK
ncbi:MAG: hypothetical protein RXR41_05975 [Candidatus Marsarchaeota archaeon]